MSLLALSNIGHSYGTHIVLEGATLSIEPGEKVGLVGRNGCGKTTLMKIIQGAIKPDSGGLQLQRGSRVGYLSQDPDLPADESVRDAAEGAFEELHRLHQELHGVFEQMARAEEAALARLLRRQEELEAQVQTAGGYAIDHRIDAMLHGLGFSDDQFGITVKNLSGGQKGRLGLARLLLQAPDLLLLDEPTNHLDIAGRRWLEEFLAAEYPGAVLMVSHDRWLLDRVVHRIIEVDRGRIWDSPGNYHKYVELRRERQLTQARVFDKQQDRIRAEQQFIDRYRAGQRAKQARGRQSRLERFKRDELVERPMELDVMGLSLPPAPRSGEMVVSADGIAKRYGSRTLFENLDLSIQRGDRIGVIGPNGSGKTTLVRVLLGEIEPDEGTVRLGSRLSVGYSRQTHEHLDLSLPVWQYLQSVIVSIDGAARASEQQARDLAGAFLFSGGDQDKPLSAMSGGERSRAVLAGLVASAKNLLVLDEPSNHLDIPSAERLEAALAPGGGYDGTLILISHDRQLLQDTCTKLIAFDGTGGVKMFEGTYADWERREKEQAAAATARRSERPARRETARRQATKERPAKSAAATMIASLARLDFKKLEAKIESIQQRIAGIDQRMLDPEVHGDFKACEALGTERAGLLAELEPLEMEWARRAEQA
jgi:ATP-binding cassette subfamily F protein 3